MNGDRNPSREGVIDITPPNPSGSLSCQIFVSWSELIGVDYVSERSVVLHELMKSNYMVTCGRGLRLCG